MARHQERRYPIGSISEGTMRPEDPIPEFLSELRYGMRERRIKNHARQYREINKASEAENSALVAPTTGPRSSSRTAS